MPPFSLLLNYTLKNDGFDIVIAESAAAGFAEPEDAVSDVLILDLNMAESSGSGVCRRASSTAHLTLCRF